MPILHKILAAKLGFEPQTRDLDRLLEGLELCTGFKIEHTQGLHGMARVIDAYWGSGKDLPPGVLKKLFAAVGLNVPGDAFIKHYFLRKEWIGHEISAATQFYMACERFATDALWHYGSMPRAWRVLSQAQEFPQQGENQKKLAYLLDRPEPPDFGNLTAEEAWSLFILNPGPHVILTGKIMPRLRKLVSEKYSGLLALDEQNHILRVNKLGLHALEDGDRLEELHTDLIQCFKSCPHLDQKAVEKLYEKCVMYLRAYKIGFHATEIYQNIPALDFYVATSMRSQDDLEGIRDFLATIKAEPGIQELKLRLFNPTACIDRDALLKGVLEQAMLRKSRGLVMVAGMKDSLGKDSEASSTLSEGKPVIVYVPRVYADHPDYQALEDRASLYMRDHPLKAQTSFVHGVQHGMLVARTAKEVAELIRCVLTDNLEFNIENLSDRVLLKEKISGCTVRFYIKDVALTHAIENTPRLQGLLREQVSSSSTPVIFNAALLDPITEARGLPPYHPGLLIEDHKIPKWVQNAVKRSADQLELTPARLTEFNALAKSYEANLKNHPTRTDFEVLADLEDLLAEVTGIADPWLEWKRSATYQTSVVAREWKARNLTDALRLAGASNLTGREAVDFWRRSGNRDENYTGLLERLQQTPFAKAQQGLGAEELLASLQTKYQHVLYVLGSASEAGAGIEVVRQLKELGHKVVVAVKQSPRLLAITRADIENDPALRPYLDLANVIAYDENSGGRNLSAIDLYHSSADFGAAWQQADLILFQGKGHFQTVRAAAEAGNLSRSVAFVFGNNADPGSIPGRHYDSGSIVCEYHPAAGRTIAPTIEESVWSAIRSDQIRGVEDAKAGVKKLIEEKKALVQKQIDDAHAAGKRIVYGSTIVASFGQVPLNLEIGKFVVERLYDHFGGRDKVFVINPGAGEYFMKGATGNDFMEVWGYALRGKDQNGRPNIDVMHFLGEELIKTYFESKGEPMPEDYVRLGSFVFSVGCRQEWDIMCEVRAQNQQDLGLKGQVRFYIDLKEETNPMPFSHKTQYGKDDPASKKG